VLAIALAFLTVAGWRVFAAVHDATIDQTRIRAAQTASSRVMAYQLDEETGIRGYTGTGAAFFLEPYDAAVAEMAGAFAGLDHELEAPGLDRMRSIEADEKRLNRRWLLTIARPLRADWRLSPASLEVQRRGKAIVDRFRSDDSDMRMGLDAAAAGADSNAQRNLLYLLLFIVASLVFVTAAAIALVLTRIAQGSKSLFNLVVESTPSAMVLVNEHGHITLVNAQSEKLFGYTRDELLGQSIEFLMPEGFRRRHPGLRSSFRSAPVAREMGAGRDLCGRRKDGSEVPVEIGLNPIRVGGKAFTLAAITDITERKRAERERERLSLRVRLATQGARVGIWDWDMVADTLVCDPVMHDLYGFAGDQFFPMYDTWLAAVHDDDRERLVRELSQAASSNAPLATEFRVVWPAGDVHYIRAIGTVSYDGSGMPERMVGTSWDVTEMRMLNAQLQQEKEAQERLSARISLATKAAQVGIWEWNVRSGAVEWDSIMFRLFGFADTIGPATYEMWTGSLHQDDRARAEHELAQAASTGATFDTEFRVVWPSGEVRNIRATAVVVRDADRLAERMIGTNWDVTEVRLLTGRLRVAAEHERAAAAAVQETNRLMAMAEHMAKVGYWRLDAASKEFTWSEQIYRIFDLATTFRPTLENAIPFFHPDERAGARAVLEEVLASGIQYIHASRLQLADGSIRHILSSGRAEFNSDGTVEAVFGVLQDVTATKEAERDREYGLMRISIAAQAGQVGIWESNAATDTLVWDSTMYVLYGVDAAHFSPTYEAFISLIHDDDRARVMREIELAACGDATLDTEYRVVWPGGEAHNIRAMATLSRSVNGSPERLIGTNWDVTEVRSLAEQLQQEKDAATFAADHDSLTQLPNRSNITTRLGRSLEKVRAGGVRFAVCFIDLDNFKQVNDTMGHLAGDQLLVEVGRRLSAVIRPSDTVARVGGDEFMMIVEDANSQTIDAVTKRIVTTLESKLSVGGVRISVTASIGVVLVDKTYSSEADVVRDADIAMYAAKDRGRNRSAIFTTQLREEFVLANDAQLTLRRALDLEQFMLAYQPIISLCRSDTRPVAFEALLRWKQSDGQLLPAATFIKTAEQTGMIVELGYWVLREACAQAGRWPGRDNEVILTTVNVSPKQLSEPGFASAVKGIVFDARIEPALLAIEVTEGILIADASLAVMAELRAFGIKIYIDDFGTGYSSLSYLRKFPVDRIKIDRSFVSGAGDGLADPVIVNAIISLAHKLGVQVVAEGVETERQRAALTELGCDDAQGFLFSKALPAQEACRLLAGGGQCSSNAAAL
jgi:diguanylate cyclase (GGDEF)-like protein/PAS domain S-box-containing protein